MCNIHAFNDGEKFQTFHRFGKLQVTAKSWCQTAIRLCLMAFHLRCEYNIVYVQNLLQIISLIFMPETLRASLIFCKCINSNKIHANHLYISITVTYDINKGTYGTLVKIIF